ncbi:MAG: molybdate ABC transporter substrate-binding protein [Deferribacterota bacterium]|nr:molybdate ABC transporter substrate-binding protein [Deferribacterota bacterium]
MRVVIILLFCLVTSTIYAENIYWYIGAGLKEPAKEITSKYNKTHDNKVILILGGSGQLYQKIIMSKKGDIFTPGGEKYYKIALKEGVIYKGEKLLVNTPVFGISKRASDKINSFKDLLKPGVKIVLGNPKTMELGAAFEKMSEKMPKDILEAITKNTILKALNQPQIVNYIRTSTVDAGILFEADAKMYSIEYIKIPRKYSVDVIAYIALIKYSKNKELAQSFLGYIRKNANIFSRYGYKVVME